MADKYANLDLADGDNDGSSWANAFRTVAALKTYFTTNVAVNDVLYIMQSTITLADAWDFSGKDGAAATPITVIGVPDGTTAAPPVYADWADANLSGGADGRPTFVCGANAVTCGDYWKFFNIIFTTTEANGIAAGLTCTFYNCKVVASSSTNDRAGFYLPAAYSTLISCEACGDSGGNHVCRAIATNGYVYGAKAVFCYVHDCRTGFYQAQQGATIILFNIFEDCAVYGVQLAGGSGSIIMNNSFNDCPVGIQGSTQQAVCLNNALKSCSTDGIAWSTQTDSSFHWKNAGHEDAGDVVDMWQGVAITSPHGDLEWLNDDVEFTADGNLSLAGTSPCIDNGLALVLGVG